MNANAVPLLAIFEKKMRLEVPLFQRQYVWSREQQWEPLWEDISRKFAEYLEGRKDGPVHFLGAMVLDQKQTPTTPVERRQVIDGQQRLTTLQIFLSALRDFCHEHACEELAQECESFTLNKGMMANPTVDRFKVWPTQRDQTQFSDVVAAGSRAAVEAKYPLTRRKWARKDDPRPRMVEAYLFFHDRLRSFFIGTETDPPLGVAAPLPQRLEECFQALKSALQVVVIDLTEKDDAQVIFETLNARGEPLLPADLLRNYVFLRAARQDEEPDELYEKFWRRFDDPFWRHEVRQGRLARPRSDLFMQHFLASRQTRDIPVRHLFAEYKFWIEHDRPFPTVRDEVATLARQGEDFRRLADPKRTDVIYPLATFLARFEVRTADPLLLHLFDVGLPDAAWRAVSTTLESYLLRRAVCGLTTKNYNRIFLGLTRTLRREGTSAEAVRAQLAALTGDSTEWPSDSAFREAWRTKHAYQTLHPSGKIEHVLMRLSESYVTNRTEPVVVDGRLTIEHLMPQDWITHWPLPDGSKGLSSAELWSASPDGPRADATRRRNAAVQTLGNLTILTQSLNSSVSNKPWAVKRVELLHASILPINAQLHGVETWDEAAIEIRSDQLFQRALQIWPRPHV